MVCLLFKRVSKVKSQKSEVRRVCLALEASLVLVLGSELLACVGIDAPAGGPVALLGRVGTVDLARGELRDLGLRWSCYFYRFVILA